MNAHELAQRLADRAPDVAQYLLPNGKRKGPEWCVGSVRGEPGDSLKVRLSGSKAGIWSDFSEQLAGDLLDLWVHVRNQTMAEALVDVRKYLGVRDELPERPGKAYKRPQKPQAGKAKGLVLTWLRGRGLAEQTIADFKIAEMARNGKVYAVFPYLRDGELINAKYRNVEDKKDMLQEGGAEPCLFGWHLIDPRARHVAITEGEIDAMTLHQVGIPALSVNQGAKNHQWIESDWERLEAFSTIWICFDNDEPGQLGAREVATRLGLERCRLVNFGAKDANELLQQGANRAVFHGCIDRAQTIDPAELRSIGDYAGLVKSMFYPADTSETHPVLTFCGRRQGWFEFRPGELSVWTGYNGHGKSLLLGQVLLGLMQQGERCCVFSGEMPPGQQGKRLSRQATGLDRPSPQFLDSVFSWLRDRMWLFDLTGTATVDRLLEVFRYGRKRYGISHFVIDSLMTTDVIEDGPGAITSQKEAMRKITAFAKAFGVHMHLVAHPRKGQSENSAPGKLDVSGSGKITDMADNVFSVWARRKDDEDPDDTSPDATLELFKQRNGDLQHKKLSLWFHKPGQQFHADSFRRHYQYVPHEGSPSVMQQQMEAQA